LTTTERESCYIRNAEREIKKTTYRSYEGTSQVGNHAPVEGDDPHTQATDGSKKGVYHRIVGSNPAKPVEVTEPCKDIPREPVPNKVTDENINEEAFTTDVIWHGLAIILVKSVEEAQVGQGTWPYHARRPDDELAEEATHRKSEDLRSNREKDLVAQRSQLAIEDALGEDYNCRIWTVRYISHNDDTNMLLDGKRPRVERPLETKSIELLPGKNTGESMAKRE